MAQTVRNILRDEDRERLDAIASDRSRAPEHIQRAKIVLFFAERLPVLEIARRTGVSRPAVWRWQQRYGEEGVDGLLRDKTQAGPRPARREARRQISRTDLLGVARRRHSLDGPRHDEDQGDFAAGGAAPLGKASPPVASHPHLQALERSVIRTSMRPWSRAVVP